MVPHAPPAREQNRPPINMHTDGRPTTRTTPRTTPRMLLAFLNDVPANDVPSTCQLTKCQQCTSNVPATRQLTTCARCSYFVSVFQLCFGNDTGGPWAGPGCSLPEDVFKNRKGLFQKNRQGVFSQNATQTVANRRGGATSSVVRFEPVVFRSAFPRALRKVLFQERSEKCVVGRRVVRI